MIREAAKQNAKCHKMQAINIIKLISQPSPAPNIMNHTTRLNRRKEAEASYPIWLAPIIPPSNSPPRTSPGSSQCGIVSRL